jgi:hypothetical protein
MRAGSSTTPRANEGDDGGAVSTAIARKTRDRLISINAPIARSRTTPFSTIVNPAADRRTLQSRNAPCFSLCEHGEHLARTVHDRAPGQRAPNSVFIAARPAAIAAWRPRLSGHTLLAQKPNSRCDLAKKLV